MLLSFVTPLNQSNGDSKDVVLGVLLALRHILPNLSDCCVERDTMKDSFGGRSNNQENNTAVKDFVLEQSQMQRIYELTMFCTNHADHNIITAALENLNQILSSKMREVVNVLLGEGSGPAEHDSSRQFFFSEQEVVDKMDSMSMTDEPHVDTLSLTDGDNDASTFSMMPQGRVS